MLGPLLLALMNCDEISQTICVQMPRANRTVMKVKKGDGGKKERREGGKDGSMGMEERFDSRGCGQASRQRRPPLPSALLAVRVHLIHNLHFPDY